MNRRKPGRNNFKGRKSKNPKQKYMGDQDPRVDRGLAPELKCIDTVVSFAPVSVTTGSIITLNWPGYGTNYNERVGDRIRIISIEWKSQAKITGGDYLDSLRTILVQENGESVGTPTMQSVLQPYSTDAFTYSPFLYNVRNIYTPLVDNYDCLSDAGSSAIVIHALKRVAREPDIRFIAGGNVPYSGALYFLALSDNSNALTALYGVFRVWYIDS